MIAKFLNRFFLLITSRPMLTMLVLAMFAAILPMVLEQWYFFTHYWSIEPSEKDLESMEDLIDGMAGILVAAGVFLEERETLRRINSHLTETEPTQIYMNEVAHHNGMGILLLGLFMEIGTLLIRMPERIIHINHTVERLIFGVCLFLSVITLFILFDFLKDYIKTYFTRK